MSQSQQLCMLERKKEEERGPGSQVIPAHLKQRSQAKRGWGGGGLGGVVLDVRANQGNPEKQNTEGLSCTWAESFEAKASVPRLAQCKDDNCQLLHKDTGVQKTPHSLCIRRGA